jgi:perosamine synthetase
VIEGRQKSAAMLIDALLSIPGVQVVARQEPDTVHGFYALVALIDPAACGFDRQTFIEAMHAENMDMVSVPRQMRSMADFNLFAEFNKPDNAASSAGHSLRNSKHITATAVQFFVPSAAADLTDDTDVSKVADAIYKVGSALSRPSE